MAWQRLAEGGVTKQSVDVQEWKKNDASQEEKEFGTWMQNCNRTVLMLSFPGADWDWAI